MEIEENLLKEKINEEKPLNKVENTLNWGFHCEKLQLAIEKQGVGNHWGDLKEKGGIWDLE